MEENNNSEEPKLDKYTEEKVQKGIETLLNEKELKIKWRKELEDNPAVVNYFKNFNGNALEDFIKSYLPQKYSYYVYGDINKQRADEKRNQWIDIAYKQLNVILQKKLFDQQCLWRAEQITLEGVEISNDFEVWSNDVFNCPFLELITSTEIQMYQAFLANYHLDRESLNDVWIEWQNHFEFKAAYTTSENHNYTEMPDWYDFHNGRTGNGILLLMQDIRGDKEQFYIDLYEESVRPQREAEQAKWETNSDSRPYLNSYSEDHLAYFVATFEDKECQNKYKNYHDSRKSNAEIEHEEILFTIMDLDEPIPVESNSNLIDAIHIAYNKYYFNKISEHLPYAFEQYMLSKKMGFSIENKKSEFYVKRREHNRNAILAGRALNGEPRNFDF